MRRTTTNERSFTSLALTHLLLSAVIAGVAGCGGDEGESNPPYNEVALPEINGAVAAADFCGVADRIHCAGAVGCCSDEDAGYADVDECIQKSSCAEGMGAVLQSSLVADGTLVYAADAAGDYLRGLATTVSQCGTHAEHVSKPTFLIGSRDEGADCSPQGTDRANTFTCKPGLSCDLTFDPKAGTEKGACRVAGPVSPDDDAGPGYCVAPLEETPPSNATPAKMFIRVKSSDNSGSSGDVTLEYAIGGSYWGCTITDTLGNGEEATCDAYYKGTVTNSNDEYFFITMNSDDGLRVDTICAYDSSDNDIECAGDFFDYGNNDGWSENCGAWVPWDWGYYCGSMWIDGDGHGNCTKFQIHSDNHNYTTCVD
jgi:hypothetical protein